MTLIFAIGSRSISLFVVWCGAGGVSLCLSAQLCSMWIIVWLCIRCLSADPHNVVVDYTHVASFGRSSGLLHMVGMIGQ